MPRQSITQLLSASKDQISYNDLFIGTAPYDFNYNLNTESFVGYFKNYSTSIFAVPFNNTYINYNNTGSSVFNSNKIKSEIESVTFDNYGNVIEILPKTRVESEVDTFIGSIAMSIGPDIAENNNNGYFQSTTPIASTRNNIITNKVVVISSKSSSRDEGNWGLLFNKTFNYSKSIVTYRHSRCDGSESAENVSYFKFIIYWNGKNNTRILGTAMIGTNPSSDDVNSYVWRDQIVKDNTETYPMRSFFAPNTDSEYQNFYHNIAMAIEVDGENKKINKLPITKYCPDTDRETHTVSVTIESFA
jgi:hypothetical protein